MLFKLSSALRNAGYFGIGLACAAGGVNFSAPRRTRNPRGKVVVITGGSRGLGLALAEELARRGARLVLAARDPYELDRARRMLIATGLAKEVDVLTVSADLCIQADAEGLIEQATRHFGQVDVLINNAGIITVGPIENHSAADFHRAMEANFFSGLYCTLSVLPQMTGRRDGAIVNITSVGGKVAVPHLLAYAASKFAAVGFSEGLAVELRRKGIRVTTVVPGLMRTGSHRNALFTGDAAREYRWFSLAANLPGLSAAADRAARKIVNAIVAGAAEVTITPQAFLASRFANVSPALTQQVMRGMHLLQPAGGSVDAPSVRGEEARSREWLPAATLGAAAARRYNQTEVVSR